MGKFSATSNAIKVPDTGLPVAAPDASGVAMKFGDSPSIDAFARLRVSNPQTIFDSKQIFDNLPLVYDDQEVSGSGTTSVYSQDKACTTIGVAALAAGKRVRQTFQRFNYQPGKSQLVLLTATMGAGGTGIKAVVGQLDDNNGIYFASDGAVLMAGMRSSVTGTPVDTEVTQANFNIDKMDGTGVSGITIDPTKSQIMIFDYEWLGVGRIRMGFVIDGIPYYCHQFLNTNNLTTVYMSTPNLPIRYSIENDGTGAETTMDHICSSVISEGGQTNTGILRYSSTEGTHVDANAVGTIYAVHGMRLKSTNLGCTVFLEGISILGATTDNYEWMIILNPTIAGTAPTFTDETNSSVQVASGVTANTVTGGIKFDGGFVKASGQSGDLTIDVSNARYIGAAIDDTPDELWLCVRPLSSNADINGGISRRELS